MIERGRWKTHYRLEKYRDGKLRDIVEFENNCLLNTGVAELWALLKGTSSNHFSEAKTTIGVGDSSTAASPAQTDLQALSHKTYVVMSGGYPSISTTKITFRASFGTSDANYEWNEFVIRQSDSEICLNRKVNAVGLKTSSDTWVIDISVILS